MKAIMIKSQVFLLLFALAQFGNAQDKYATKAAAVSVSGTSTMHDWEMKAANGDCSMVVLMNDAGQITDVQSMNFSIGAKALKSGKDGMDKNAYKTLKADKNPNITAVLKSADVTTKDHVTYTVNAKINLTIAGKTLETPLVATLKPNKSGGIAVIAEKKMGMKEYDMNPPSFMLGAVKTGNDVVLKFNFTANK
ncbi:MAG: YceI family protein [Saprospiraceae bacterium]|nr:YceI family protein [Saprospiraceae bacterium]